MRQLLCAISLFLQMGLLAEATNLQYDTFDGREMSYETTYLKDYRKSDYSVQTADLTFELDEERTVVKSMISVRRECEHNAPLVLHGEDLELVSVKVNCEKVPYELDDKTLTIPNMPQECIVEIENIISPKANTQLMGLYVSSGIFCTQNEPEGFRRITYFLDRPDVMGVYTTKIIADKKKYPVLLANGNCVERGDLEGGKHFTVWEDPHPKPCYLFALVAGDLEHISDTFTTMSGKEVKLEIYSDKKYLSRLSHAMDALKQSMKWDEEVFGREYDLDIFMIVAVDSFNAGAMENKGLNIFNTSCLLCDTETSTDANFTRVAGVVAHEYFHNWTGDRVTCRDWFQLTLKEGLTVFRDHEFTADTTSRPVKRIEDVINLRARQFREDAGPTSHPIQPASFIKIDNFYTATVYEKGAEVIRMIHTLIGKEAFRKGMDTYFEYYDGQAVTTEEFVHAMEVGSGHDLKQFRNWYHQNGTPVVEVQTEYDPSTQTAFIRVVQDCVKTRKQQPFYFPLNVALFSQDGKKFEERMLIVSKEEETFTFENVDEKPVVSLNRNFSAPIIVHSDQTEDDLSKLFAFDDDPFAQWEAGQTLAQKRLDHAVKQGVRDGKEIAGEAFTKGFGDVLDNANLELAYKALALGVPVESTLALQYDVIDFDAIHETREAMIRHLASTHRDKIYALYEELARDTTYELTPESMGKRKLKNTLLAYIRRLSDVELILKQYRDATNMTDSFGALMQLTHVQCAERDEAMQHFYEKWKHDLLTINKYQSAIASSHAGDTLEKVYEAIEDPMFDFTIPNMVRSIIAVFGTNAIHFHRKDGKGYKFLADMLIKVDGINPQVSSRIATGFTFYGKVDEGRKALMRKEMTRILDTEGISSNLYEVISKSIQS